MKKKLRLLDERMEGVDAMRQEREGKITLRSRCIDPDRETVSRYAGEAQRVTRQSASLIKQGVWLCLLGSNWLNRIEERGFGRLTRWALRCLERR